MPQVLGGGFRVVELGDRQYVASVPKELDRDSNTVMHTAQVSFRFPSLAPACWQPSQVARQRSMSASRYRSTQAVSCCDQSSSLWTTTAIVTNVVGPGLCIRGRPGGKAVMAADPHISGPTKAAVTGVASLICRRCWINI